MTDTHTDRRDAGEALGEHAARESMKVDYPTPPYKVTDLTPKIEGKPGNGRFDQIYEVEDTAGNKKIVIAEAKGPHADTSTRKGLDGRRYEQGHPKYVESVIANMWDNGTPEEQELAMKLARAQEAETLEYRKVTAQVETPSNSKPTETGDSNPSDGPPQKKQKVDQPHVYAGHARVDYDVRLP
jgi:hypothetical protein